MNRMVQLFLGFYLSVAKVSCFAIPSCYDRPKYVGQAQIICTSHCCRDSKTYLILSLKEQLDIGLNPRNLRAVFIFLRYSFIPALGLVLLSPGPPAAGRAGTDSRCSVISFTNIILRLLRPIMVYILFFHPTFVLNFPFEHRCRFWKNK